MAKNKGVNPVVVIVGVGVAVVGTAALAFAFMGTQTETQVVIVGGTPDQQSLSAGTLIDGVLNFASSGFGVIGDLFTKKSKKKK